VPVGRLLRACAPIVFCHRGWLAAVAAVSLLSAVLGPMQGVIVKRVVDGLQGKGVSMAQAVLEAIPWYVAVLLGLALLSFAEKCLKGFYDPHLIFALQRRYLERRRHGHSATDVSRLQYDCMYGRKALEVFARDSWGIAVSVTAVLCFQGALAPQWLPALVLLSLVLIALALAFGVGSTRSNQAMFEAVEPVAWCAEPARAHELVDRQMELYGRIKSREAWMGASEVVMQLILWIGCLATVWLAQRFDGVLLSAEPDAGGLALFVANVQIISRPLIESGKAYNKFCSNMPALRRTLFPRESGEPET